jgi:predicted ester cyclase
MSSLGNSTRRDGVVPEARDMAHPTTVGCWSGIEDLRAPFPIGRAAGGVVVSRREDARSQRYRGVADRYDRRVAAAEDRGSVRARLGWPADPATHRKIRRLWQRHSIAEDRRDIEGLIATLAPECVYEIAGTGLRWEGHHGARTFYTELFNAFPDNRFALTDIVIGPQGVFEAVALEATHRQRFAGLEPSGRPIRLELAILFPWDPATELFTGEQIFIDRAALAQEAGG